MKITITDDVVVKFKALLKTLSKRNPYTEKQVGQAILALVDFVCEESDEAFRESLAVRLVSPSHRKRALIEGLKSLAETDDKAALETLERGLQRLKVRLKKSAEPLVPSASK